jgi:long-chain acyl-CoA synthetase
MPLAEHLSRAVDIDAEHVALFAGGRRWTYGDLDEISDRLAASLARLGIEKGDRVAIHLANCPELVFAYYACFKLGAISVPINNRFAAPEIEYALNHSACRVCISQPDLYAGVASIRAALTTVEHFFLVDAGGDASLPTGTRAFSDLVERPADGAAFPPVPVDAVAAILYTSGTTSRPKGVTHTHRSLSATVDHHGKHIDLRSDDVVCVVPPLCHIFGFATQMIGSVWARACMMLLPRFDPEAVLRAVQGHQATRLVGLPTMLQALVSHPGAAEFSLRSLRTCIGGGDAVPVALQDRFLATFGVTILEGCGMTEVIPFTLNMPGAHRRGSIGRVCPGMEIRLVDDAGRDVPSGAVGELLVRSDAAMIGYWLEPEISAATLAGGYVHTGDLARVDDDGYYWFMGRKKEIIIRAGSNISPLEVEEALYQHPTVRECGVVGVPDADVGEVVWAYVAPRDHEPLTAEDLQAFLAERIAPYKVPEAIRFRGELPKGPTGKIHRRTLRDWATHERTAATEQSAGGSVR